MINHKFSDRNLWFNPILCSDFLHQETRKLRFMGDATRYLGATGGVTNMNGNGIALIDQPIYIYTYNAVRTMSCLPFPSHHHYYRWYKLTIPSHG